MSGASSREFSVYDSDEDEDVTDTTSDHALALCLRVDELCLPGCEPGGGSCDRQDHQSGLTFSCLARAAGDLMGVLLIWGLSLRRRLPRPRITSVVADKPSVSPVLKRPPKTRVMEVECSGSTGKGSATQYVSTVLSLLNTKPSASADRALRIIVSARSQAKAGFSVLQGVSHGSVLAVIFTGELWFGEVYRYGALQRSKSAQLTIKDWQHPINLHDLPEGSDKIAFQFYWFTMRGKRNGWKVARSRHSRLRRLVMMLVRIIIS